MLFWTLLEAEPGWMLIPHRIVWLGYFLSLREGDDVKASECVSSVEVGLPLRFLEDVRKI